MSLLAAIASQKRRLDPDATAYANAVVAAGGTVSGGQRAALSLFVAGEKTAGRWASFKRIYLPVWGVAAANAIDMVTLTSGTWSGGVTHAAGYAQGNGSTGYFNIGATPADCGVTLTSATMGALIYEKDSTIQRNWMGVVIGGARFLLTDWGESESGRIFDHTNTSTGRLDSLPQSMQPGIVSARVVGTTQSLRVRQASGTLSESRTVGTLGSLPVGNIFAMAINLNGSGFTAVQDKYGAFFVGAGMSDSDDTAFTLALKTLWETLTGLSLP